MRYSKIFAALCVSALTALCLTSCEVHFFSKSYDVEWYVVAIPAAAVTVAATLIAGWAISRNTYICPHCGKKFRPKITQTMLSLHVGTDRYFKCPECGRRSFCKKEDTRKRKVNGMDVSSSERIPPIRHRAVLVVKIGENIFYANLEDNAAAEEFISKLSPMRIRSEMSADGSKFEGALPWALEDAGETAEADPGDIIVRGDRIAICLNKISGDFARVARMGESSKEKLVSSYGGNAEVSFNLEWDE